MRYVYTLLLFLGFYTVKSQSDSLIILQIDALKYAQRIDNKMTKIDREILAAGDKYLNLLKKHEERIAKKLQKIDPQLANQLFIDVNAKYNGMLQFISNPIPSVNTRNHEYLSLLDTLKTSLNLLNKLHANSLSKVDEVEELSKALKKMDKLKDNFSKCDAVRTFIKERENLIKRSISKYGNLISIKKYSQQAFYYKAQLAEYRRLLEHPDKILSKSITLMRNSTMFKKFFAKNSELASLFAIPGSDMEATFGSSSSLQTKESIKTVIKEKYGSQASIKSIVGQQFGSTGNPISNLKDPLDKVLKPSGTDETVTFIPNTQKTKSTKERIEIGLNFQTLQANGIFPITTDIGLNIGYRLNDKSTAGIGIAYKIGWGEGFNKIKISHQGLGLRSFVDFKLKRSIYLTGGAELNYRSVIHDFSQLRDYSAWQRSGLMGLTKKFAAGKKIKGNMQILWDFLSYQQTPRTQALLYRIGYNF